MSLPLLREKFKDTRIVLASGSPRRQSLLRELGIDFEVAGNQGADETWPRYLDKGEIPLFLAGKKADAYTGITGDDVLLITADTIVWCRKKVMDKPAGRDDAIAILKELSGRRHQVITGVCLRNSRKSVSFTSATSVWFRDLTDEEITWYVDNCDPYDKAGAYGIQEWIGLVAIESIRGSYFNVMGLPVDRLYSELMKF